MQISRNQFTLGLLSAAFGAGAKGAEAQISGNSVPTTPTAANQKSYLFSNSVFEFAFLSALGRAYWGAGNVGKVLYISRQVRDGDFEGEFRAFKDAGDEAVQLARDSESKSHKESARQAYFWAQNYYAAATDFVDSSSDPSRFQPTWELLYDAWLAAIALLDPPARPVRIPYEGIELRGFFFRGKGSSDRRRLLIINNGSDGSPLEGLMMGGYGAMARGYDVLTFDGPGQNYALWKQNLYFRPDWEKVITPVVDLALTLPDIDPNKIALLGISQAGYWVPRAVAFEKRIAAAVADPGVVDVSTSWTASLPPLMIKLIEDGRKEQFDAIMDKEMPAAVKAALRFRMRPFGVTSYYDAFKATTEYRLKDVAGRITCPMLITQPANEAFWPGQSAELFAMLKGPKTLMPFSESDGADLHCEIKGLGIRDVRIFNWLDEAIG
jgi:hypothetical protein